MLANYQTRNLDGQQGAVSALAGKDMSLRNEKTLPKHPRDKETLARSRHASTDTTGCLCLLQLIEWEFVGKRDRR